MSDPLTASTNAGYQAALSKHPNWHQLGGVQSWSTYVKKYGAAAGRTRIAPAHEANRLRRLAYPTPGEQALRRLLAQHGLRVELWTTRYDYLTDAAFAEVSRYTALAEGAVGHYACDILVPHQHVAIEVYGGIHRICQEHDAKRRSFLEDHGLTVVEITNDQVLHAPTTVLNHLRTVLDFPARRGGTPPAAVAESRSGGTQ